MLLHRWAWFSALVPSLFLGGVATLPAEDFAGNVDPRVAQDIADLKTQLNSGLRCRRPEEFAFIDLIVQMVDNDQLTVELVKSTFQWARKKKPYPFVYFERAIRERAAEAGVIIP